MESRKSSFSSRLPVAADEPNLSAVGAFAALPSMSVVRISGLVGALCLGLMVGLVLGSGAHTVSVLLIGLGGALMLAACAVTEWQGPGRNS